MPSAALSTSFWGWFSNLICQVVHMFVQRGRMHCRWCSLFVLPSVGIHTLSYHLGFLMITVNFLRQTAVQLRVKVKSVWPFILSTSVCSFRQFIQVSECSAGLFVLASAAMCSYFLMFPVCAAAFPSLLSRIKPQDIQKANGGLESLLPTTCIFFTFCQ